VNDQATTLARKPLVGTAMLRREDRRLLLGQGQYVGDLVLPRMLHAVFAAPLRMRVSFRSIWRAPPPPPEWCMY
jgi:CO/xanthine dehydrogenase Mo-binding subunit